MINECKEDYMKMDVKQLILFRARVISLLGQFVPILFLVSLYGTLLERFDALYILLRNQELSSKSGICNNRFRD